MQHRVLSSVLVSALAVPVLTGCLATSEREGLRDAGVVMHHLPVGEDGVLPFDFKPYQGGTAVVGLDEIAFWVKDGVGYWVSEAAREAAPELAQASENIRYDKAFKAIFWEEELAERALDEGLEKLDSATTRNAID